MMYGGMYSNGPERPWKNNVTGKQQTTEFDWRRKNTRHAIRDFSLFVLFVLFLFWLGSR